MGGEAKQQAGKLNRNDKGPRANAGAFVYDVTENLFLTKHEPWGAHP
jgi:hypothetical protein